MRINILTIYYALGAALLAASIHELSVNTHFEVDDFQVDVDQEDDVAVSCCYLLVDKTIRLVYHFFLYSTCSHSFGFRYDPNCTR
jgi:hypothetical protein